MSRQTPPTHDEQERLRLAREREFLRSVRDIEAMKEPVQLSPLVTVSLQQSWAVLGVKGSGKTTFSQHLVPRLNQCYPHVMNYILDSKGYGEYDEWASLPGAILDIGGAPPAPLRTPGGIQIWKPPTNDFAAYDAWFESIRTAQQPCIILIDELASITLKNGTTPANYTLLLKQGRVMRMSIISMTQEAAYIDRNVFGQMDHFIRFYLINQQDLLKTSKLLGFSQKNYYRNPRSAYGFFHRDLSKPTSPTMEYTGYREFLGMSA